MIGLAACTVRASVWTESGKVLHCCCFSAAIMEFLVALQRHFLSFKTEQKSMLQSVTVSVTHRFIACQGQIKYER